MGEEKRIYSLNLVRYLKSKNLTDYKLLMGLF